MKKHLFALASAALLAPATVAGEGDKPAATAADKPVVVGQTLAADGGGYYSDGSLLGGKHGKGCCKDPCESCVWVYGEYINWWAKRDETPRLLGFRSNGVAGTATGTFGGDVNDSEHQGFRAGGGFFPHKGSKNLGVEVNVFWLNNTKERADVNGDANTTVFRPFLDAAARQDAELILGGGNSPFNANASASHSSQFWGGSLGLRHRLNGDDCGESCGDNGCGGDGCGNSCKTCIAVQYGYQYYQLNDTVEIRTLQSTGVVARVQQFVREEFDTADQYHGGYIGLAGELNCGQWFVAGNARAGIGYLQEVSRINGSTTTTIGRVETTTPIGSVLVLPSNVGTRVGEDWTWSAEAGARIGYQVTCWFRPYLGYNALYIDNIQRAGGTIDPAVNRDQLAGFGATPPLPAYNPRRDSFWAHGLTAGFELKF